MSKQTNNLKKVDDTIVSQIENRFGEVKDFVEDKMDSATELYETSQETAKTFLRETRSQIKKHPLAAIAAAACAGWVLSRLFKKD